MSAPSAVDLAKARFALAPGEMVEVRSLAGVPVDREALASAEHEVVKAHRRQLVADSAVLLGALSGFVGALVSVATDQPAGVILVLAIFFFATTGFAAFSSEVRENAEEALARLDEPTVQVPRTVRDAYARIKGVADRDDVPEWVITTALHAERVVIEIAEHHANGTGSGAACGRLADALFTAAAQIDTWDLMSRTADVTDEVESADALLMLEAATAASDILAVEIATSQEVIR